MDLYLRAFHGVSDWGWVESKLPDVHQTPDMCGITAIDRDENNTLGVFLMYNLTPDSLNVHVIIDDGECHRGGVVEECCDVIFNVLQKKVCYAWISSDNEKSIRLHKRIGGEELARYPGKLKEGVDKILMELRPENCRYLPKHKEVA